MCRLFKSDQKSTFLNKNRKIVYFCYYGPVITSVFLSVKRLIRQKWFHPLRSNGQAQSHSLYSIHSAIKIKHHKAEAATNVRFNLNKIQDLDLNYLGDSETVHHFKHIDRFFVVLY